MSPTLTPSGRYRYFPSLAVDRNGNVGLAYGFSSPTEYPGIAYTPISAGVPGSEVVLKADEALLISPRYGDYAATALDPFDNLTIWHVEEYAKNGGGWGTWISALQIEGPPPVPDFSLGATLAPGSPPLVMPGGSETYTVTANAFAGFQRNRLALGERPPGGRQRRALTGLGHAVGHVVGGDGSAHRHDERRHARRQLHPHHHGDGRHRLAHGDGHPWGSRTSRFPTPAHGAWSGDGI